MPGPVGKKTYRSQPAWYQLANISIPLIARRARRLLEKREKTETEKTDPHKTPQLERWTEVERELREKIPAEFNTLDRLQEHINTWTECDGTKITDLFKGLHTERERLDVLLGSSIVLPDSYLHEKERFLDVHDSDNDDSLIIEVEQRGDEGRLLSVKRRRGKEVLAPALTLTPKNEPNLTPNVKNTVNTDSSVGDRPAKKTSALKEVCDNAENTEPGVHNEPKSMTAMTLIPGQRLSKLQRATARRRVREAELQAAIQAGTRVASDGSADTKGVESLILELEQSRNKRTKRRQRHQASKRRRKLAATADPEVKTEIPSEISLQAK